MIVCQESATELLTLPVSPKIPRIVDAVHDDRIFSLLDKFSESVCRIARFEDVCQKRRPEKVLKLVPGPAGSVRRILI